MRVQVRLVVIDSVTFHFRHDNSSLGSRSRTLAAMAQLAMATAERHNVALVYMNQVGCQRATCTLEAWLHTHGAPCRFWQQAGCARWRRACLARALQVTTRLTANVTSAALVPALGERCGAGVHCDAAVPCCAALCV
jgi:hypothetical protein